MVQDAPKAKTAPGETGRPVAPDSRRVYDGDAIHGVVNQILAALERLEQQLSTLQRPPEMPSRPILTTAEAMQLTRKNSRSALFRWSVAWGVKSSGAGRWSLLRIQRGLLRESRSDRSRTRRAASKDSHVFKFPAPKTNEQFLPEAFPSRLAVGHPPTYPKGPMAGGPHA